MEARKIKKKILFGITSLQLGGAERVLVDIVNKLADKYDITIFSIYDKGELKADLSNKINFKALYNCKYEELNKIKKIWIPIKILLFGKAIYRRKIKKDYDVEVAFLEGPVTRMFSYKGEASKKIAWIHNDINQVFGNGKKAKIKGSIDKKIYYRYDNLVFVSKDNMEQFKKLYPSIEENKMKLIYNYIDRDLVIEKSNEFTSELHNYQDKNFVTVCRLVQQKAIDRLITVHSKLIKQGYYHNIFVIGDGPEKEKLQKLIESENVANSFFLLGKKQNPYPYIKDADYFCLLSYFEGYGMVLEEAKILNKKIVITDTAAREALQNYKDCEILDNSADAIYEGFCKILNANQEDVNNNNVKYDNSHILQEIIDILEK